MTFWGWAITGIFGLLIVFMMAKFIIEFIWNRRLNAFKLSEHMAKVKLPFERFVKYAYSFSLSTAVVILTVGCSAFVPLTSLGNKDLVNAQRVGTELRMNSLIEDYRLSNKYFYYESIPSMVDDALDGFSSNDLTRDYTGTNVQVEGVDEGDVLKTDGYRIFYAPRYYNVIEVIDIEDNHDMTHVASMSLEDFRVDSLYLTDDYLIVIGYRYEETIYPMDTMDIYWGFYFYEQTASILVFDKETLEETYRLETDLSFIDHRLMDDTLYIVSNKWFYLDQDHRPEFDVIVNGITTTSYLSYMDIYYFDDVPANAMTVITTLDLTTFEHQSQGFIAPTDQIYASENAIYTLNTQYLYDENAEGYTYDIKTNIFKYKIDANDQTIDYVASTVIDGYVEDRYWVDESDDYLRVVTSRLSWIGEDPNRLYILAENAETDTFDEIAVLDENIGHDGETVKSVRFHENYVNIVTYETMDPLYTIDLSNPELPYISETPIEEAGYSEYLHVWDDDSHIIGLGFLDQDENGSLDGLKVSAYDTSIGSDSIVSDEMPYGNELGWGYSYTEAMYNPKALMVDVSLGLFGFPMVSHHYNATTDEYSYQSAFRIYQIDFDAANVLGNPIMVVGDTTEFYNQIDRGVFINDFVYTFSAHEILSFDLANEISVQQILISYA